MFGGEEWSYYLQAEVCAVFSKSIFSLLLGEKKQREIINLIRKKKITNTTVITGLNFQTLHTYIRTHSTVLITVSDVATSQFYLRVRPKLSCSLF